MKIKKIILLLWNKINKSKKEILKIIELNLLKEMKILWIFELIKKKTIIKSFNIRFNIINTINKKIFLRYTQVEHKKCFNSIKIIII